METVGDRVKARRVELGWTQEALAEKAGVSTSFLSDLENDRRGASAKNLHDIAQVLGLSLDYLMTGRGPKTAQDADSREVRIPSSLARLASEAGLSFRQTLTLLDIQRQIIAALKTEATPGTAGPVSPL